MTHSSNPRRRERWIFSLPHNGQCRGPIHHETEWVLAIVPLYSRPRCPTGSSNRPVPKSGFTPFSACAILSRSL